MAGAIELLEQKAQSGGGADGDGGGDGGRRGGGGADGGGGGGDGGRDGGGGDGRVAKTLAREQILSAIEHVEQLEQFRTAGTGEPGRAMAVRENAGQRRVQFDDAVAKNAKSPEELLAVSVLEEAASRCWYTLAA